MNLNLLVAKNHFFLNFLILRLNIFFGKNHSPLKTARVRKRRNVRDHLRILEGLREALHNVSTADAPRCRRLVLRSARRRRGRTPGSNLAPVLEKSADILPGKKRKKKKKKKFMLAFQFVSRWGRAQNGKSMPGWGFPIPSNEIGAAYQYDPSGEKALGFGKGC